jgi:hypothetical protein
MDPRQCLIEAATAMTRGDHATANARLDDYHHWRARGGFEPQGLTCARLGLRNLPGDNFAALLLTAGAQRGE